MNTKSLVTTPLPKLQLFIVIFIQIAEPVTSTVVYPFVNNLVRAIGITGGDEKKTGYYVGIIESVFYAAEALTVLQWGRASDSIGRRTILLGGMAGLTAAMLGFGLSKSYCMLILSRGAQGAFNGNIGVTKSVIAEITDITNAAQAYSFLPVAWSIGSTLGPFIGGAFAEPAKRWPKLFNKLDLFKYNPYLLPCIVASIIPVLAFIFAFLGLKETLPSTARRERRFEVSVPGADESASITSRLPVMSRDLDYGTIARVQPNNSPTECSKPLDPVNTTPPPSFRDILIPRVLIPCINFCFLAFLDQSLLVLLPLMYSTPLALGGLDLPPSAIGNILGVWGVINGIIQVTCFAWVRRCLGHRNCYMLGIICLGLCFALFPVLAKLTVWDGDKVGGWVMLGIALQLGAYIFSYMSYACMFMYIAAAAPRSSRGATNGLVQLMISSVRAFAPSVASLLFSYSLQLSGDGSKVGKYLVYIFLCTFSATAFWWSFRLPVVFEGDCSE